MNIWFLLAGGSAIITGFTHVFLGGKFVARPLLAGTELTHVSKYTNYYCWHMVSIVHYTLAAMFIYAALNKQAIELAYAATFLASTFVIWNVILIFKTKSRVHHFPQWALQLPTAFLGAVGGVQLPTMALAMAGLHYA